MRIDDELIEVAAAASSGNVPEGASRADLTGWITKLPSSESDPYLVRLTGEEGDLVLRTELTPRFEEATFPRESPSSVPGGRRTIGQILDARNALHGTEPRKATEKAAREHVRLKEENTQAHYLDELPLREPKVWIEIGEPIAIKREDDYDNVCTVIAELSDFDFAGCSGQIDRWLLT